MKSLPSLQHENIDNSNGFEQIIPLYQIHYKKIEP